jgi:hypothetical protein
MLELVRSFLETIPNFQPSSDGTQALCDCFACGGYTDRSGGCLSIKIEPEPGEPMFYKCFRASCGVSGILTPKILEQMGCSDVETLMEMETYNKSCHIKSDKRFIVKHQRKYAMVNLNNETNRKKLKYINNRLGVDFSTSDLRDYKIQLSLYDFLDINGIKKLAFKPGYCDILNQWTIGFLSMYSDYIICRDISSDQRTGKRYTQYRASGTPAKTDMKLYCIPGEIDLLSPEPADINIAEGAFSILGAYLHTDLGRDHRNNIWLANCGSEFKNTLTHVVKQFGLLDVNLHIWSDSEIKVSKYEKLIESLSDRMHFNSVLVHYNTKAEDFGHAAKDIKVSTIEI